MQDILIRIETDDFAAWEEQHYLHAGNRATYGIEDGPAYRDLENPNAALFHIRTEDVDRAMGWFRVRYVQGGDQAGEGHGKVLLRRAASRSRLTRSIAHRRRPWLHPTSVTTTASRHGGICNGRRVSSWAASPATWPTRT